MEEYTHYPRAERADTPGCTVQCIFKLLDRVYLSASFTQEARVAFEVFQKGSAPVPTIPAATIQKRGLISLNRAAFALIDGAKAVELLWDPDRRVIGFRPCALDSPNAYPVRPQSSKTDKGPVLIAGNLFTRYIGLDTSEARRYKPQLEDGILCIDLNMEGQKVTSNRNRSASNKGPEPEAEAE
jgi:hypothetical protein